jgi:hypothetical protein
MGPFLTVVAAADSSGKKSNLRTIALVALLVNCVAFA